MSRLSEALSEARQQAENDWIVATITEIADDGSYVCQAPGRTAFRARPCDEAGYAVNNQIFAHVADPSTPTIAGISPWRC